MARLVVLSEGFTGLTCELKVDKTTIGRLEDNAFQIPEQSVSSHHCEVVQRGVELVVKDLNSTNGTFINGEPVKEAVLKSGQILRLGQVELRLETGASRPAPPAPAAAPVAAPSAKKPLDKTAVLPQGVKVGDLEQGSRPVNFQGSAAFAKKSDKINKVFIIIGIAFGVLILVSLILAWLSFHR
jgi:predicted component of type VI protein secretion system